MAQVIVDRTEAKAFILDWAARMSAFKLTDRDVEPLLNLLYPDPSIIVALPQAKLESVAGLIHQATVIMLQSKNFDETNVDRDQQLGMYLQKRELHMLKKCVELNCWTAQWLVAHAKENP